MKNLSSITYLKTFSAGKEMLSAPKRAAAAEKYIVNAAEKLEPD